MKKELHVEESRLMLSKVNRDAEYKYEEKAIIKGDSWRDCDILFLYEKLNEEINEYKVAVGSKKSSYGELLDIINVAKMLAAREKENEK